MELKRCPFCLNEAHHCSFEEIGYKHIIECDECGINTGYWLTKKQAYKAWNRRRNIPKINFGR